MKLEDIVQKWDYPNADNIDWNDAKNDIDKLISEIKRLREAHREA